MSFLYLVRILQHRVVEHRLGQHLLQLGVLVRQRLQSLGIRDFETTILGLPFVECRTADVVLAAYLSRLRPGLLLPQNPDVAQPLAFSRPRRARQPGAVAAMTWAIIDAVSIDFFSPKLPGGRSKPARSFRRNHKPDATRTLRRVSSRTQRWEVDRLGPTFFVDRMLWNCAD